VLVLAVCVCLTAAKNLNNRDVLKKLLTALNNEKRQGSGSGSGSGSGDYKRQYGSGSGSGSGSGDYKRQDGSGSGSGSGSGDYKRLSGEAAVLKRLISLFDKEKKHATGKAEHKKRQDLVCDDGYVPCDSMDMCTKIEELCDGEKQCIDGSDEFPQYCPEKRAGEAAVLKRLINLFDKEKKQETETISIEITDETETTITEFEDFKPSKRRAVHNKRQDEDECPDDYAECKTGNECVLLSSLCNGVLDCSDTSDEDDKFCEIWGYNDPPETTEKRDDDDCTQVDTEDTYEDDEGNTFKITSTTYEGNCLKKRQDEDCVCDQTDVQTDFDDGTTELSSTNKCTCLTLTPVSLSKRQDEEECDYEEVYDPETGEVVAVEITCPFERGLSKLLASRQETADLCDCAQSTDPLNPGQTTFDVTQTCLCPVKVNKKQAHSKRRKGHKYGK